MQNGCSKINRRDALFLTVLSPLIGRPAGHVSSRLSVESYIWIQYAQRLHKPLGAVLDVIFPMAREAGFRNIELNHDFLTPELRARVLQLVAVNRLALPSVYVGGPMHERVLAEHTISQCLETAALCRKFGCRAIVTNPDPKPSGAPKSDAELAFQVRMLNRLGRALARDGFQLWTHAHAPAMADNAREWRYNLHHTNPEYVWICLDLDWVYQGGQDPLQLLREAGRRVASLHLRNSRHKVWLESFGEGDIDYHKVAGYLSQARLRPLLVVELAYRKNTVVTRPLEEDLRLSRIYTQRVFGVRV
ncbi:MAG: sugar phosphate isomerase/epimerase family protein [Terriglobia bacterium]